MKKKKIELNRKLSLTKDTIGSLQEKLYSIKGGISGKVCEPPVSGTGCGCLRDTCTLKPCDILQADLGLA